MSGRLKGLKPWSCLASCFAYFLGIPEEKLYEEVGHDGSAIWWPKATGNDQRRAFHIQEMIALALKYQVPCWYLEAHPSYADVRACEACGAPGVHILPHPVDILEVMKSSSGILAGLVDDKPHAMVWDAGSRQFFDPKGRILIFEEVHFTIDFFCAMSRRGSVL